VDTAQLGFDLGTELALLGVRHLIGLHNQLHAAGLASAVFFGAMLAKVPPLKVAASILVLVEEAHSCEMISGGRQWMMLLGAD